MITFSFHFNDQLFVKIKKSNDFNYKTNKPVTNQKDFVILFIKFVVSYEPLCRQCMSVTIYLGKCL